MTPSLRGVFPMLYTPFDVRDRLDENALRAEVAHVLAHPVAGLAALGLGGEAAALSEEERRQVAEIVLAAAGAAPVIVGCSAEDSKTAIRLATHGADRGAAAIMLAAPAQPGIGRDQLRSYYGAVADAVAPTPVMVQDAPGYLGVALDPDFVLALSDRHPNVRYAKTEAVPAGPATAALADGSAGRVSVFGGNGGLYLLDQLDAGAVGVIPGAEVPGAWAAIYTAHAAGATHTAFELFSRVLPLIVYEIQTLAMFIGCGKEILRRQGLFSNASLRGGGSPLGPTQHERLTVYLDWLAAASPTATGTV